MSHTLDTINDQSSVSVVLNLITYMFYYWYFNQCLYITLVTVVTHFKLWYYYNNIL